MPDITFVVIDAIYAWETSASLESLSDHIATTAIMASSINLGTSRLCLAETGDSSGASNTMLNEVHNSQQHLARMFSPEVRVQRRRSSMAQGIAQRRRNSTDLLGGMASSKDLLTVNRPQAIGGAHPKTATLSGTVPNAVENTVVAVKLLAEPVKSVHEMDVILEALGFLNSSLVASMCVTCV